MIAPWALYAVVLTSLTALAAAAAERAAATWQRPRRLTWLAALVAAVCLPAILATGIATKRPPGRSVAIVDQPLTRVGSIESTSGLGTPAPVSGDVRRRRPIEVRAAMAAIEPALVALWAVSSATLLVVLCGAAIRLAKTRRRWREVECDGVRVLIAAEAGPAVIGVLRPHIVLPEWALSLDVRTRSLMLRHELEHIRARDPAVLFLATLSLTLVPWNVALWFIARRLRLAVELDCDRRVVKGSGVVFEYGLLLLDVGARRRTRLPMGAALVQPRSFLARRITAMIANNPRHRALASVLAVTCVAVVTIAAVAIPRPEAIRLSSVMPHQTSSHVTQRHMTDRQAMAATTQAAPTRRASLAARGQGGIIPSRTATAESLPRITADWENAPLVDIVAAFSRFSGRKITVAQGENALVTAHIVDEPWDEALALIANRSGYRLIVQRDSSIVISSAVTAPTAAYLAGLSGRRSADNDATNIMAVARERANRLIVGRLLDDSTGTAIAGARVNVIGVQAIGEPNRACASERGEFQLMVPDGEVWLDASARGYEFSRLTLASHDSIAVFRGRRTKRFSGARVSRGQIESVNVLRGAAATALYGARAANGVVVIGTVNGGNRDSLGSLISYRLGLPIGPTPLFVIDGVIVGPEAVDVITPCEQR